MKRSLVGFLAAVAAFQLSAAPSEARYDFRKRLSAPREFRSNGFTGDPVAKDETVLDDRWTLVVESDEPVVKHAAADLRDFLEKRCGARCAGKDGKKRIVVAVSPEKNPLTSRITASENEIRVTGATPREVAQGCYRLEDELTRRDQPAVKRGTRTYTRMFSPRMTHSGYEIEKFPDWHMDQIAHAGMDAILVYVTDPPDMTRNGREDFNALVKRAAEHGLDVYAYADFYWNPLLKNPCDPGAEDYYDSVFGSIVRNAPGLKGLICVGESCYFPERGESPWKNGSAEPDRHNGWLPHPDWAEFLKVVTKVTRRYRPDFDVVFWTYNWYRRPEKDRLALLERIPTNVTVHVTFEMGAPAYEKDGVEFHVDDYSITEPGPGTTFVSEARGCARRGIPLTSMTNTGGRTWDFGGLAFEPVPQAWMARFDKLRDAQARWGLKGLMDSHHYGFTPNVVARVAKAAFTREFGEREIAEALRTAAACDFGPGAADEVLSVWKDWSEAFQWHSARNYDQSGPLRIGPSYPLVRPGAPFPPSPRPVYEWVKGKRNGNGWLYLAPSYDCPPESLDGRIRTDERELALLGRGNSRLEAVLDRVPAAHLPAARRMLGYGKYMEATVRTLRNVRAYKKACLAGDEAARLRVLDEEEANVRAILPWVEQDEKLGWEPSMHRVTDAFMLKWKLGLLADARRTR